MRASRFLISTVREIPQDAQAASHQLMLKAGLVRKQGAGLYHILPMGLRTFRKIENIVREEMNRSGALEFQLPILTPSELWEKSGRWETMGREMFRIKDRHDVWNALGPTHEESFTDLMKHFIRSHRDLPINVYQIHTKFRDEIRPRFGVIRSREFCMKDAYSFHSDEESLKETYKEMKVAYRRIFTRVGLETIPVEAQSGSMGGAVSEEFMVPSKIGEETLLLSEGGKYSGNQEKTAVIYTETPVNLNQLVRSDNLKKLDTPECETIEKLGQFLKIDIKKILKTIIYSADNKIIAICLRADRQVNENKLAAHLGCLELRPATESEINSIGSVMGYAGPHKLEKADRILWDTSVIYGSEWIIGANQKDVHFSDYNPSPEIEVLDLALAVGGDPSPEGDGKLREVKGIEVGHIFQLGNKYSKTFEINFLDEDGKAKIPTMGCYGIGINRTMAAIVEQSNDEKGIIWPITAAPFEVVLIGITKGEEENKVTENFYNQLLNAGVDVLWDDRNQRPGVKFNDAELIGFPIRLTIGKNYFENGILECKFRENEEVIQIKGDLQKMVETVCNVIEEKKALLNKKADSFMDL